MSVVVSAAPLPPEAVPAAEGALLGGNCANDDEEQISAVAIVMALNASMNRSMPQTSVVRRSLSTMSATQSLEAARATLCLEIAETGRLTDRGTRISNNIAVNVQNCRLHTTKAGSARFGCRGRWLCGERLRQPGQKAWRNTLQTMEPLQTHRRKLQPRGRHCACNWCFPSVGRSCTELR